MVDVTKVHQRQAGGGTKARVVGVDAARGIALIAMIIIHVLPGWNADYEPTTAWMVFAGRGAALFAFLAGVSLAFTSGGRRPATGPQLSASRAALATRAVLILVLGLAMGFVDIEESVILAYYAVMFLLAIPFLGCSARVLGLLAAGFAVVGPIIMQGLRDYLPEPGYDPTLATIFTEPVRTGTQLLLTGTYPAIPWMAYILAGMAVGRLDLRLRATQLRLLVGGIVTAVVFWVGSALLLGPFGVTGILEKLSGGDDSAAEFVRDTLIWGPDPTLPTDTWWWLAVHAPYSSTPFELLYTIGTSAAVLGAMLLLASYFASRLSVLIAMGSMTLTLYTGHLLLLATGIFSSRPATALVFHLALAACFALLWRHLLGQGPLERFIAAATHGVRDIVWEAAATDRVHVEGATRSTNGTTDNVATGEAGDGGEEPRSNNNP